MKYREVVIEDDKNIGSAGTETVDINVTDPITELILRFRVVNDSTVLDDEPPHRQITKIELVDGGTVYWSLSGPEAVAAYCYDSGKWPVCMFNESLSEPQFIHLPIRFGQYLGDPIHGFDPTRLKNPQLKFTWALQAGYTTTDLTLGVLAKVMEGVAAPAKALMWKTISAWTSTAGGVKRIELPVDHPYRRMMVRADYADTKFDTILTHFKMDCELGKFIPFDLNVSEFQDIVQQEFGPFSYVKYDRWNSDGGKRGFIAGLTSALAMPEAQGLIASAYTARNEWYRTWIVSHDGTKGTDLRVLVRFEGYNPCNTWCYQFGQKDVPETWFPAPTYKSIDAKITDSVASAACAVALQQVVPLP